ncbi:MAG TPA: hypothetical protein VHY37_11025 [Tepidisphaeraceae bacterium]|nr:hypothetical protein [Tepidisphaeraceae bacterium]
MAISLSPETEKLLEEKLKSGEFQSADEMIRAALLALDEMDLTLDDETLDALDRAEGEIERGEVIEWEEIRERLRAKYYRIKARPPTVYIMTIRHGSRRQPRRFS